MDEPAKGNTSKCVRRHRNMYASRLCIPGSNSFYAGNVNVVVRSAREFLGEKLKSGSAAGHIHREGREKSINYVDDRCKSSWV
jgi:hypothetical protein